MLDNSHWACRCIFYILLVLIGTYTDCAVASETPSNPSTRLVTVTYVPWWVNWRLPDPTIGGLPLQMINSDSCRLKDYKQIAYAQSISALERAGIDVICWDTFGQPQINQAADFLKICSKMKTNLRIVPLLDVHIHTRPNIKGVVKRFRRMIDAYRNIPEFGQFHYKPYWWTWGTRNLPPEAWQTIFAGLKDPRHKMKWIGHTENRLQAYSSIFAGQYSWQPQPIEIIDDFELKWGQAVRTSPNPQVHISPIYLMFRRYGYGFNYVDPNGFQLFLKTWQAAINNNSEWVHITTWNDYDEYTMFEPTVSHGFCLADLNAYYAQLWKSAGKVVEPQRMRVFVAYPRGVNTGETAYVDVVGIFRESDLPAFVNVGLINAQGKYFSLGHKTINKAGVQSAFYRFQVTADMGKVLQPEIEISPRGGHNRKWGCELPWIDIYDLGHIRDRNIWMAELGRQIADASVSIELANAHSDYKGRFLPKRAMLRIAIKEINDLNYLMLKRNEQQSAVIKDGVAYIPARHFGGNFGWQSYDRIRIEHQNDSQLVFTVLEPPSKYGLTVNSGTTNVANPKRNRDLTGYSRDWYTVVAVTNDWRRAFSKPLVVERKKPDSTIVDYRSMQDYSGYVLDDTLKGLDLKDWSTSKPRLRKYNGRMALVLSDATNVQMPNNTLVASNLEVTVSFKRIRKAPAFVINSPQLSLYVDHNDRLIAARKSWDHNKKRQIWVFVKSPAPITDHKPTTCRVRITPTSLKLFVAGKLQATAPLPGRPLNDEATILIGSPLYKVLLPDHMKDKYPIRFEIELYHLKVTTIAP